MFLNKMQKLFLAMKFVVNTEESQWLTPAARSPWQGLGSHQDFLFFPWSVLRNQAEVTEWRVGFPPYHGQARCLVMFGALCHLYLSLTLWSSMCLVPRTLPADTHTHTPLLHLWHTAHLCFHWRWGPQETEKGIATHSRTHTWQESLKFTKHNMRLSRLNVDVCMLSVSRFVCLTRVRGLFGLSK